MASLSAHLVSEPLDESITLYGWNFVRVHICEFFWLDRPCDRCASETTGSVLMGCDLGPYVDRRRRIIPSKLRYAVTSHGTRNAYVRTYERRKGEREGGDIHDKTWEPKAAIEIKFKDDNDFDFSRELGK